MKRNCLVGIVFGIMIIGSACGKQPEKEVVTEVIIHTQQSTEEPVIIRENEVASSESSSIEATTVEVQEVEEIIPFADRDNVVYEVTDEYYENGVVKIHYPQVTGMENTEVQNKINECIKEKILGLDGDDINEYSVYELNYEIATKGTGVLSVVFNGYMNVKMAAHPSNIVKTLNIDMKTGNNLRLKDYADFEYIVSCLESDYDYTLVSDTMTLEDFSMFLNNGYITDYAIMLLDYDIDFEHADMYPTGYSCIKDNKVHLFVSAEHAVGDYIEVCFEKQL